jgi:hypothetical protein
LRENDTELDDASGSTAEVNETLQVNWGKDFFYTRYTIKKDMLSAKWRWA